MIPTFPAFKKIDLHDKESIDAFVRNAPPYSDFNFTNLYAWNLDDGREWSILHDNLVIRFTDYRTDQPFYSFIGKVNLPETAQAIFDHICLYNLPKSLQFITKEVATVLESSGYTVTPDHTNHDYIFSVEDLVRNDGSKYRAKRKMIKRFNSNYPNAAVDVCELTSDYPQAQLYEVFENWIRQKKLLGGTTSEYQNEKRALSRLLESANHHKLILSTLSVDKSLIGFSIDEIVSPTHALSHFIKADTHYRGVYEYLNHSVASLLKQKNILFWNWEQDLNLEGLRRVKQSYRPVSLLEKYTVSLRS